MIDLNKIYRFFIKTLMCICLFLGLGIICKLDSNYKDSIQRNLYQEYLDFSNIKAFYDKYLGGVFPIEDVYNGRLQDVFNENLVYKSATAYEDGVMLSVDYNYLVPAINGGIVVYIGEKEKYGNVVIVEGDNDIDIWYGNLCNTMVKIYDGVSSGSYLGEACDNKVYVVYTKKNQFLNYEEYLN